MCTARKRSSYDADSSDDDFDYSLQKRLRTDCTKNSVRNNSKLQEENSKRIHKTKKRPQAKLKIPVKSNTSCASGSVTYSIDSPTSLLMEDSNETDNSLSSSQIISDILDDCDDVSRDVLCAVKPQAVLNTSKSPIQRPIKVPSSPKKQSSLLEFFKVQRNGVVLTKETSITNKASSRSSNGTNFKMYQSGSSQMVVTKPSESKSDSSFYNKTNRGCPFYKKIPGISQLILVSQASCGCM